MRLCASTYGKTNFPLVIQKTGTEAKGGHTAASVHCCQRTVSRAGANGARLRSILLREPVIFVSVELLRFPTLKVSEARSCRT